MLAKAWGTNLGSPANMCSSMVMCPYITAPHKEDEADVITGYARISHQVYNKEDDYCRFRDAINKLVNDNFTCKLLSASRG
ncbi:hypothetical protein MLD38_015613 [Melastoma candidum]|uniref:Uncharacterized protein n=1 Tax=Melastoma candidum TaxID=119954 RepID=A0ACB9RFY7_9MYRT|nr:hypothetical protein MLD38_015613 [Melastoma candidum]